MTRRFAILLLTAAAAAGGCAGGYRGETVPAPAPLAAEYGVPPAGGTIPGERDGRVPRDPELGEVTLDEAVRLVLARGPALASSGWERMIGEAAVSGAGIYPNPAVGFEIENFGGTGLLKGAGAVESTVLLSQEIELGGKRGKRIAAASYGRDLAGWEHERATLEIIASAVTAFGEVLAAQERVALAEDLLEITRGFHRVAEERYRAGKVAELESRRAAVELVSARTALERERRELSVRRVRLAGMWGDAAARFERVSGSLDADGGPPSKAGIEQMVDASPEVRLWETAIAHEQAALALEKSRRIPDLTLTGGIRSFEETGDRGFIAGIEVPIPLFDRNQGGVREAEYRLSLVKDKSRAARTDLQVRARESFERCAGAWAEAVSIETEVLPVAESAFAAAEEAYRQGKAGQIEVLDAHRRLAETRLRRIDVLVEYHRSLAELEQIAGRRVSPATDPEGAQTQGDDHDREAETE